MAGGGMVEGARRATGNGVRKRFSIFDEKGSVLTIDTTRALGLPLQQSGVDHPGNPKPDDLRLRRQTAAPGHPGRNQGLLRAMGPCFGDPLRL